MVKETLIICLLLAGCSQTARGDFCKIAEPHRFSDAVIDHMTDEEATRELVHNEVGVKLCGWKP